MHECPNTPAEPLENLRDAFAGGLLFREDFFTETNFKKFCGANNIFIEESDSDGRAAWPKDENWLLNSVDIGNDTIVSAIQFTASRWMKEGQLRAAANLSFTEVQDILVFENVEKIMSHDWTIYPLSPIPAGMHIPHPTHPRGNIRIRYDFNTQLFSWNLVEWFSHDGKLKGCQFRAEMV